MFAKYCITIFFYSLVAFYLHIGTHGKTPSTQTVRVGSNSSVSGGEIFKVLQIYNHPQFDPYMLDYDFALLQLASDIVLNGVTKAAIKLTFQNEPVPNDVAVTIRYNKIKLINRIIIKLMLLLSILPSS